MLLLANSIYHTAHRLDRLHVRYDLSWQALDAALARRAVVARAVAVDVYGGADGGKRLAALADAAERAPRPAREACENQLCAALAMVDPAALPPALVAELADAEARVLLARRFHNDAVRDTRALGSGRWCGCCGWAEPRRCRSISRSSSARTPSRRRRRARRATRVGTGGAARRDRRGAVAVWL